MLRRRYLVTAAFVSAAAFMPFTAMVASADGLGTLDLSPSSIVEDDSGGVSFTVDGSSLPPLMVYTLHSPGLDAACTKGDTLSGQVVKADYDGNFNTVAAGSGCVAGFYCVTASETTSPYQSITGCLTLEAPGSQPVTSVATSHTPRLQRTRGLLATVLSLL